MKNTIAERIADFLKRYPPFNLLRPKQLLEISSQVRVRYLEKGLVVFNQGDVAHKEFFIVHKGAISLDRIIEGDNVTVDKCDEGDVFGLRPLIAKENYKMTALAEEESIIYGIPIDVFSPIKLKNVKVSNYLIESFATNTRNPYSDEHKGRLFVEHIDPIETDKPQFFELQPANYNKKIVTCKKDQPAMEIAKMMSGNRVGSVIVTENEMPIGIITDRDFRNKIATGLYPILTPASEIMTSPVKCFAPNVTIAQAQVAMMKHRISQFCITVDGTPNSKLIGIISEHDIVVSQGSNPSVLMKAIKRTQKTNELKEIRKKITTLLRGYIQQNIPLTHTSKIITELNDATIKRAIELSLGEMKTPPPVKFAWMSLGSQGRKEQLLNTDQDNAIVFEDVDNKKIDKTREYFLILAKSVNKKLNDIGFEYCPAEMMASNPKWCLSQTEWKSQFTNWIANPGNEEILLCSIFFDYDISFGDISLLDEMSEHIFKTTKASPIFFVHLGRSVLMNPSPLGFFRQFLVEHDGQYKDFFDLKKRALMPIIDAGRLLILSYEIKHINNTAERFEKLAELEPENRDLFLSCSYASKALLKFRTKQGLSRNDSGRYIELQSLNKEEKMKLKRCFKIIRNVQELIQLRFKLSHLI